MLFSRNIPLPRMQSQFDALAARVIKKFRLTDIRHTHALMANAIKALPPTAAHTTLEYLGHYIIHNIGWHIADRKSKILQHEGQIEDLESQCRQDPNNAQPRDALIKAAAEGSPAAREALERLGTPVIETKAEIVNPA